MTMFKGMNAIVTGGGDGIGRALAFALLKEGCSVAAVDISPSNLEKTQTLSEALARPDNSKLTLHVADVSNEEALINLRDEVCLKMATDHINLLINNAGVAGGGSLFTDSRENWERVFSINWNGVYLGVRTFLPLLQRADRGHIVNVSSLNGFWAMASPTTAHTAYSASKFAVKGFTEALITDLAINAPHIHCSVVIPGHIGTSIHGNSDAILGAQAGKFQSSKAKSENQSFDEAFKTHAPLNTETAAQIILDGVQQKKWRILVGDDATRIDKMVREQPEHAYDEDFYLEHGPKVTQSLLG